MINTEEYLSSAGEFKCRFYLRIVWNSERKHVFSLSHRSWLIEHFFPSNGAKEVHCKMTTSTIMSGITMFSLNLELKNNL